MAELVESDWVAIEVDYRAGVKTLRQIASEHGITEGAVRKRAKRDDWTRDLAAKIREKADALVRKEAVRNEVRNEVRVTEKAVVEASAELQYKVRIEQRQDIGRARKLTMTMLEELEAQTGSVGLLEQLSELLYDKGGEDGESRAAAQNKRLETFNRVISLGVRVSNMKALAESLKALIAMEREAFGIDDKRGVTATGDITISF